jgi:hypothetical protein
MLGFGKTQCCEHERYLGNLKTNYDYVITHNRHLQEQITFLKDRIDQLKNTSMIFYNNQEGLR